MIPPLILIGCLAAAQPARPSAEYKSPTTALSASAGATMFPIALALTGAAGENGFWLLLGGAVIGPSLGHFYAGNTERGVLGIVIRGAATYVVGSQLIAGLDEDPSTRYQSSILVLGVLAGIGSAVIDIGTAPLSAREHNRRLEQARLSLGPAVSPSGAFGLGVAATF